MNSFDQCFQAATGNPPFRWQRRLYERLVRGEIPARCDIATGLGKTSVIPVWALALAHQLATVSRDLQLPRRFVYLVDRRVVVDQATEEAEALLAKFRHWVTSPESQELRQVAGAFLSASCVKGDNPFTVSTLRGQHADNRRWLEDPTRPAVIIGTVDMLGSRLLFSGYGGLGRYSRSLHAGLLAQDALVVVDEAHLCPALVELLDGLARQLKRWPLIRPFHVMLLSATQPLGADGAGQAVTGTARVFSLDPGDDRKDAEVAQRLDATKRLRFVSPPAEADQKGEVALAKAMANEAVALAGGNSAVVVFADTIEQVKRVTAALKTEPHNVPEDRIVTLTGEMRGKERDELVKQPVFALFRKRRRDRGQLEHPIFLVATAAGEVGINFDADHAVCDIVPLERMIQRFGRVNRFGDSKEAHIRVVLSPPSENPSKRFDNTLILRATRCLLRKLPKENGFFAASPASVTKLLHSCAASRLLTAALSRPPVCPPLDEARIDDWALTSLKHREFPRPQVGYWLRGITPDDAPYTWLAWRADLEFATDPDDAATMAAALPLAPAELAQVRTHRAADLLGKLRKRCPDAFVAILSADGDWTGARLGDLPEKAEDRLRELVSATVVLPTNVGGLKGGVVDDSDKPVPDAVDSTRYRRVVLRPTEEGWEATELSEATPEQPLGLYDSIAEAKRNLPLALGPGLKLLHVSGPERDSDGDFGESPATGATHVAYFAVRTDLVEIPGNEDLASLQQRDVPLQEHLHQAAAVARCLCDRLGLPADLADAVIQACARHDLGKKLPQWQKAIGNVGQTPLAKSAKPGFDREATLGFRHEFLSLLEAADDPALAQHPRRDLILHLIAAHHGYARPRFPAESYAILPLQSRCAAAAHEAAIRFARLQRELGWWQLAYLEALVKCADSIASRQADALTP